MGDWYQPHRCGAKGFFKGTRACTRACTHALQSASCTWLLACACCVFAENCETPVLYFAQNWRRVTPRTQAIAYIHQQGLAIEGYVEAL